MIRYEIEDVSPKEKFLRVVYEGKSVAFDPTEFRTRRKTAQMALATVWVSLQGRRDLRETRNQALELRDVDALCEWAEIPAADREQLTALLAEVSK